MVIYVKAGYTPFHFLNVFQKQIANYESIINNEMIKGKSISVPKRVATNPDEWL